MACPFRRGRSFGTGTGRGLERAVHRVSTLQFSKAFHSNR
jgi:hypothetical protein